MENSIPIPPNATNQNSTPENERIELWIKYFNEIKIFTKAHLEFLPPNQLIDVRVPGNKESFEDYIPEHKVKGVLRIFALHRYGSFEIYYRVGITDEIFNNWLVKMTMAEAKTWLDLHEWLKKLVLEYENALEA